MKIVSAALVCLIIYVGAYLALSRPECYYPCTCPVWGPATLTHVRVPEYRVGGEIPKLIFAPLLSMDQRLRPFY
jgi:hypothetical protein